MFHKMNLKVCELRRLVSFSTQTFLIGSEVRWTNKVATVQLVSILLMSVCTLWIYKLIDMTTYRKLRNINCWLEQAGFVHQPPKYDWGCRTLTDTLCQITVLISIINLSYDIILNKHLVTRNPRIQYFQEMQNTWKGCIQVVKRKTEFSSWCFTLLGNEQCGIVGKIKTPLTKGNLAPHA